VTRSTKMLIPAVAAVAAIAAYWFLVLAPKREEISRLDAEITQQQTAAEQAEQQAAAYETAKTNYRKNYTTVTRLGKAVPGDDDVRSLLVQLDDAAKRSKVTFRSLNVEGGAAAPDSGGSGATATGALAPAPGAVPVGSAGFSAMPFKFAFGGSFLRLSDFFQRLERFVTVENGKIDVTGRLLLLGGISITPDSGDLRKLQAEITAATYLVPPTEGVTGGSTPSGPAGTGESAAPADDAGTVSTPTATITGVR
jgi:hypothetical protein